MSVTFMDENPVQIQNWYKYWEGWGVFALTYVYVALRVETCTCKRAGVLQNLL